MKKTFFFVVIMTLLGISILGTYYTVSAASVNYYVNQATGSNTNNGTSLSTPFKTIQKCADIAASGDVCNIRGGTYRETVNITRNGITFMPYNNEEVIISALEILTGWIQSGSVWRAPMNWTMNDPDATYHAGRRNGLDQLFLDGKMMVPARFPNLTMDELPVIHRSDMLQSDDAVSVSGNQYYYIENDNISSLNGMTGGFVNSTEKNRGWTMLPLVSINGNRIYFTSTWGKDNAYYFLRGHERLLDSGGERFWKKTTTSSGTRSTSQDDRDLEYFNLPRIVSGQAMIIFPSGKNPSNSVVEAKARHYVINLSSSQGTTIKNIRTIGGGIFSNLNSKNNTLDSLQIDYPSHSMDPAGKSYFQSVNLAGDDHLIKDSLIRHSATAGFMNINGKRSKAINNVMYNAGYVGGGTYAFTSQGRTNDMNGNNIEVNAGGNDAIEFSHNTLFNSTYVGVGIGLGNKIQYNDVYNTQTVSEDGGTYYSDAYIRQANNDKGNQKGAEVSYNRAHHNYDESSFGIAYYVDKWRHNIYIHHNISRAMPGAGFLSIGIQDVCTEIACDGSAGVGCREHNQNNTIYTTETLCANNFNRKTYVYNNTFIRDYSQPRNNAFMQTQTAGVSGTIMLNNITSNYTNTIGTGRIYTGNINYDKTLQFNGLPTPSDLSYFKFVNSGIIDYRIGSGSYAIDKGIRLSGITSGLPYNGTTLDVGAYEYGDLPRIAGALLREKDVENLIFTCSVTGGSTTCNISGLELGRKLPVTTQIQVGNASRGGSCINNLNYTSHIHTARCTNIPSTLVGNQTISLRFVSTGTTIAYPSQVSITGSGNNADAIPNSFSFTSVTNAVLNSGYISNAIVVTGINTGTTISIVNGRYRINGGSFTSANETVVQGDSIMVFLTSANSYSTLTSAVLTIGGIVGSFSITTTGSIIDSTPNAFSFATQTDVDLTGGFIVSEVITITGYNTGVAVFKVSGAGSFSINGGGFTTNTGTITPGQSIRVRLPGPTNYGTISTITMSIGGVTGSFTYISKASDIVPNTFSFTSVSNAALNSGYASNAITVTGINTGTTISINRGRYRINAGAFTGSSGFVTQGDTVSVYLTSANTYSAFTSAVLTIGGITGTFSITTLNTLDAIPDAFSFGNMNNAQPATTITTGPILLTGFVTGTALSIINGEYSFDNSGFASAPTIAIPGAQIRIKIALPVGFNITSSTILNAGGITGSFVVTSRPRIPPTVTNLSSITTTTALSAFTGTAYSGDTVRLFINGGLYTTGTANRSGLRSFPGMVLTTGAYHIYAAARTPISDILVGTSATVSIFIGSGSLTGCIDNPEFSFLTEGSTNVLCYETKRFRVFNANSNTALSGGNLQTGQNIKIRVRYVNFSNEAVSGKTIRVFNIPIIMQETLQPQETGAAFLYMKIFKPQSLSGFVE